MKVDFYGSRKELLQLVNQPATALRKRETLGNNFPNELGAAQDNPLEKGHKSDTPPNKLSTNLPHEIALEREPMARYSFNPPELLSPEFPAAPPIENGDNFGGDSVKTPTLLSARRIPASGETLSRQSKAERVSHVKHLVEEAGAKHGVDPALSMGVVAAESSFNPMAMSSDGHFSKGLFQLLDSTADHIISREGLKERYTPYEPKQNVDLGTRYLRYLHDLFTTETVLPNAFRSRPSANSSDLEKLAVAAFNAGEGRVAIAQQRAEEAGKDPGTYQGVRQYLPRSTQDYVDQVMTFKTRYSELFGASSEG